MSGVATAIVGAAIIGYVASDQSSDKASKAAKTELEFAQQQYQDWSDVYGPVRQNLSNYYSNLSPEAYATRGIQSIEEEFALASTRLDESLAQRGITDSGIAAGLEQTQLFDLAKSRATVRQAAPQAVAEQKLNFLSVGQGNSPVNNYQQALASQTARLSQQSNQANAAFAQSLSQATQYGLQQIGSSGGATNSSALAGTPNIDYSVGVA